MMKDEKAAWAFATGLAGIDGTDVSPELLELVAANATDEEIHRWIHEHYIEGQRIYTHEEILQMFEEDDEA